MVDGVGLYRSEFVFLKKPIDEITLEDHLSVYRDLSEVTHPGMANIRTFDLGSRQGVFRIFAPERDQSRPGSARHQAQHADAGTFSATTPGHITGQHP